MSSAAKEQKHAQALCGSEKGRAYAGDDHEAEHPALRHDIHGMYRRSGDAAVLVVLGWADFFVLAYGKAARTAGLFPGMFRNGFAAQTVFSFLFLSDAVYDYSSTLSVFIRSLPAILHFLFPDF